MGSCFFQHIFLREDEFLKPIFLKFVRQCNGNSHLLILVYRLHEKVSKLNLPISEWAFYVLRRNGMGSKNQNHCIIYERHTRLYKLSYRIDIMIKQRLCHIVVKRLRIFPSHKRQCWVSLLFYIFNILPWWWFCLQCIF